MLPTHPAARFRQRTAANVDFNEAQLGLPLGNPDDGCSPDGRSSKLFFEKSRKGLFLDEGGQK